MINKRLTLFFSSLLLIFSLATLLFGETPWPQVWAGVQQRIAGTSTQWNPLLDERLPRLIVLICTGSSLAVAGAIMQALFHNPLASPSVLGISQGGSLLAILVFVFNQQLIHPYLLPLATILGCFLTLLLIYALAYWQGSTQLNTLILTGIAVSTILLSVEGVLLYIIREQWQLVQMVAEWGAGSTIDRNWHHVHMQLPLTLVGLSGAWIYRKEINIAALGEEEAKNLGVPIEQVRWRLFLCISLLVGGALAAMGIVAFFGLILPHMLRHLQGSDHRRLLPLCMLVGATVLTAIDHFLRLFEVHALSIGNFSAIVGGVIFLILLLRLQQQPFERIGA